MRYSDLALGELEVLREAEAVAKRSEERLWCSEMRRLRGVFLAAMGADEAQIEAAFRAAIKTAKEQQSTSLMKRAEASYAEYRDLALRTRSRGK